MTAAFITARNLALLLGLSVIVSQGEAFLFFLLTARGKDAVATKHEK